MYCSCVIVFDIVCNIFSSLFELRNSLSTHCSSIVIYTQSWILEEEEVHATVADVMKRKWERL